MSEEEWNEFADDWLKKCSDDIVELAMRAALESVEKEIERQILLRDILLIRIPEWRIREITGGNLF